MVVSQMGIAFLEVSSDLLQYLFHSDRNQGWRYVWYCRNRRFQRPQAHADLPVLLLWQPVQTPDGRKRRLPSRMRQLQAEEISRCLSFAYLKRS